MMPLGEYGVRRATSAAAMDGMSATYAPEYDGGSEDSAAII